MKQNRNFAKPDENSRPIYAPTVLRVVTHHHDEGVDPETGEHWERDWDTYETKTNPTAFDYAQMGYLPVVETPPADPAPDGYHYEPRGWEVHRAYDIADEDCIRRVWEIVADPPPPPRRWTPLSIKRACGEKWDEVWVALEQAGLFYDFIMATEIVETDAAFKRGYTWAVATYGEEAVEAILAAAGEGAA